MSDKLFLEEVMRGIESGIRKRVQAEVSDKIHKEIDAIVAEEITGMAVRVSRWAEMRTMGDRLIIEVRMPVESK